MLALHDVWDKLARELGTFTRNTYANTIIYDAEDDVFLVDFQHEESRWRNGVRVTRMISFHQEIYKRTELYTYGPKQAVGWDKAINELLNKKAGVDCVVIEWTVKTAQKCLNHDWWDTREADYVLIVEAEPTSVRFYQNDKLHHNYKPAEITVRGVNVISVRFMKYGNECIPPEQKYPSSISCSAVDIGARNDVTRVALATTAITKMLSRVPKTRWDWLKSYNKVLKNHSVIQTSFMYDGKDIPEDLKPMLEYPLEEDAMFTLMLCC